jgi:hypothetical protein
MPVSVSTSMAMPFSCFSHFTTVAGNFLSSGQGHVIEALCEEEEVNVYGYNIMRRSMCTGTV